MTWQELFANKAQYGDDLMITVPGVNDPIKLGDLRAHDAARGGETATQLQARETAIAQRETTTTNAQAQLAKIIAAVSEHTGLTFDEIVQGDTAAAKAAGDRIRAAAGAAGISANPATGEINWETDPIYSPIDKRYSPVVQTTSQLQKAMRAGMTVMQEERARRQWLEFKLDNPEAAKKLKYEDAVAMAVGKKYNDEYGFPDVGKALSELAQPAVTAAHEADLIRQAEERGAAAERAKMFGAAREPGGMGTAGMEFDRKPENNGKVATIQEQLAKAMQDPAMMTGTVQ